MEMTSMVEETKRKLNRDQEKQNGKKVIIDWLDEHREKAQGENHSWTDRA